jgi:hypothetical protein
MRKIGSALIVISSLALGACGTAKTAAPSPTAKPTSTTTTTATIPVTTTTLSPQQAAQTSYFLIVSETNPLLKAIAEQYLRSDGSVPWSQAPAYCGEGANVLQRFGQLLATTVWPPEYQPQVTDLIAKNSVLAQLTFECADLPGTAKALSALWQQLQAAGAEKSAATSTLRGVLGLPIER